MNSIKSLLVHLDGTVRAEARLRLAHQLAGVHQAKVTALFAVAPRYLPLLPLAGGVPPSPTPSPTDIDLAHRVHALAMFERARDAAAPESEWLELSGEPVISTFARRALASDLLVLGQRDPADATGFDVPGDFVESVIIDSGKPALVIPYAGEATAAPQVVLVAWKPTRESARALTAALPFLRGAKQVYLVCAEENADYMESAPLEVPEYLRLHGIEHVREHRWLSERDAGNELLALAADTGAEMIVMGCYGHSRARELVLGGATRTVLESMTAPVLMAH
ncbi:MULTISPECIES: universal stress protein [unclassified Variovorax]|uniref:universal stress protein n=1 Tax=unclassified Variovorax TaxID=663243 RepID=UPI003ECD922F